MDRNSRNRNPRDDGEHPSAKGQRGLLGEVFGFTAHCLAVLFILIVIAIFARDFSIDFHTVLRESRSHKTELAPNATSLK